MVSMRMSEQDFTLSLQTLRVMFLNPKSLTLWTLPLALAVLLRVITRKFDHRFIFPSCTFDAHICFK